MTTYREYEKTLPKEKDHVQFFELPDEMRAELFVTVFNSGGVASEYGIALRDMESGEIVPESVYRGFKSMADAKNAIVKKYLNEVQP